jgi:hypothetical protein
MPRRAAPAVVVEGSVARIRSPGVWTDGALRGGRGRADPACKFDDSAGFAWLRATLAGCHGGNQEPRRGASCPVAGGTLERLR